MTTNAARQAVFGTSELLEQIILYLPMKTIFGIQRVCQKFRNVIATSPEIQTKMFLRRERTCRRRRGCLNLPQGTDTYAETMPASEKSIRTRLVG